MSEDRDQGDGGGLALGLLEVPRAEWKATPTPSAESAEFWQPKLGPQQVDRLKLRRHDGAEVLIVKGARVSWANPCGIGGVTVTATVRELLVDEGGSLSVIALDVAPNDQLRAIVNELRASIFGGSAWGQVPSRLDGDGGTVRVTGESFREAVRRGEIAVLEVPAPRLDAPELRARSAAGLPVKASEIKAAKARPH